MPSAALVGLEAIVARAFGGSATLTVESPVAYGDEDAFAKRVPTDARGPRKSVAAIDMRGHSTECDVCRALHRQLAIMTRYDYYMTMTGIRIADLKSRLSEYLRKVRAGGSLTILDRDTPIARIVPWKAGNGSLKLRPPLPGAPKLQRVPLPPPLRLRGDIVKLLMEERQGDR